MLESIPHDGAKQEAQEEDKKKPNAWCISEPLCIANSAIIVFVYAQTSLKDHPSIMSNKSSLHKHKDSLSIK